MKPIEPAELSALLDGELPPERAAEVRAAVEADAALGAEYARLRALHATWSAAAGSAAFRPAVRAARRTSWRFWAQMAGGVLVLTAVRFVPKFAPLLPGTLLLAAALAAVLGWVLWSSLRANDVERSADGPRAA